MVLSVDAEACEGHGAKHELGENDDSVGSVSSNAMIDSPSSVLSTGQKASTTKEVRQSNVSELVAKSKKAASSLWTLLHAKNCRLGVNRCSHKGCPEAKLMFLHLKTCSAELLEPCPNQHNGCQDARKLLAHYRRCRDIRARQAQSPAAKTQQHVCLVCSLVARHAKFTLDRGAPGGRSISPKCGTSKHLIPSLNLSCDLSDSRVGRSSTGSSDHALDENCGFLPSRPLALDDGRPRFAFSRPLSKGTSGFQALQAAVSCALGSNSASSHSLDPIDEIETENKGFERTYNQRPRAESLDVQSTQSNTTLKVGGQKNMSYLYLAAVESLEEEIPSPARPRSQSCSVPSARNPASTVGCDDPMLQKAIGDELQCILGGDS